MVGDFVKFNHFNRKYGIVTSVSKNWLTIVTEDGTMSADREDVYPLTLSDYEKMSVEEIEFLIGEFLNVEKERMAIVDCRNLD